MAALGDFDPAHYMLCPGLVGGQCNPIIPKDVVCTGPNLGKRYRKPGGHSKTVVVLLVKSDATQLAVERFTLFRVLTLGFRQSVIVPEVGFKMGVVTVVALTSKVPRQKCIHESVGRMQESSRISTSNLPRTHAPRTTESLRFWLWLPRLLGNLSDPHGTATLI
ncbi:hypothetical protein BDZ97DRAFT_1759136 [Flammula alnicola]|nr:hypothetical protein BDZ97DRAFT_1759136 [Flammula alnicola]